MFFFLNFIITLYLAMKRFSDGSPLDVLQMKNCLKLYNTILHRQIQILFL